MGTLRNNPVFGKELRSHLLSRRQSRGARAATIGGSALMVALLYWACLRALGRGHLAGRDLFLLIVYGQLTLLVFLSPSLTANAITQEREQQTWNALLLTRLHAGEIVVGKLLARLAPAVVLMLVFLPLALIAAAFGNVGWRGLLRSGGLLVATSVFYATIGLACSWAFRRTSVATAMAFGIVAFLVVGTFLFHQLWTAGIAGARWIGPERFPPLYLNPYLALASALRDIDPNAISLPAAPLRANLFVCILGTLALIGGMIRRLARGPKEMEG
jgi:ABC-type transport system involved in multi-copper enzyme maturation permease subunit